MNKVMPITYITISLQISLASKWKKFCKKINSTVSGELCSLMEDRMKVDEQMNDLKEQEQKVIQTEIINRIKTEGNKNAS